MKKIYIVLTHTGTALSRLIKHYTRDEYSHVSISLDENLNQMYSFGRLNPYNPFWAGFVHERANDGTFKRFKNTIACVYSLEIEDGKYDIINKIIKDMEKDSKIYKFNIIGLFAVALHLRLRFKNSFYCAEFVKYLLEKSHVTSNLPDVIKPEDFKSMNNLKKIYKGVLRDYNIEYNNMLMYGN